MAGIGNPKPKRLIRVEAISDAQRRTLSAMQNGEGTCKCGRVFTPLSPKFILCNMTVEHPTDKNLRGALLMSAFCYSCFQEIDGLLKRLSTAGLGWLRHKNG